jgi:hypothetical protein
MGGQEFIVLILVSLMAWCTTKIAGAISTAAYGVAIHLS